MSLSLSLPLPFTFGAGAGAGASSDSGPAAALKAEKDAPRLFNSCVFMCLCSYVRMFVCSFACFGRGGNVKEI